MNMRHPGEVPTDKINELVEKHGDSMSPEGRRLFDMANAMNRAIAAQLPPVTVTARHRDLPLRVQIDPDVLVRELAAALACSGFTLRPNPESGDLWLTRAK